MAKSSVYAKKLDEIANSIGDELRASNFRKSKKLFNRHQPDGIVHVVDFQMGGSWSILQGKFTIEVGIFIPEVYNAFTEKPVPKFITSSGCEERKRLGVLGINQKDTWWDLTGDPKSIENEILELLSKYGEQYFSQFSSREKLLSQWEIKRDKKNLPERKILIMAIILAHSGQKKRSAELLEMEFGGQYKTSFLEYAENMALRLGLDFPVLK